MALLQSAAQSLQKSNRIIVVTGPRATGKTTFSVSASQFAGRHIEGDLDENKERRRTRQCKDVLIIQGDKEGVLGAMDMGLHPAFVVDMTDCTSWTVYYQRLKDALKEAQPLVEDGTLKVVVVDLNFPAKLIERHVEDGIKRNPEQHVQLGMKDWRIVANCGLALHQVFSQLLGVTVVANAQVKASFSAMETAAAADAAQARAIGGERSKFSIDLPKGIATPWLDNASFMFARHLHFAKERDADGERKREYRITMQSSATYEAKSRAQNRLPRNPLGVSTLRHILEQAYGKAI